MPGDTGEPFGATLKAALTAYKHRKDISGAFQKFTDALLGKKQRVAFTGISGAGKTVLLDHVTGKAFEEAYQPPPSSVRPEREKVRHDERRFHHVVVPGEGLSQRVETLGHGLINR